MKNLLAIVIVSGAVLVGCGDDKGGGSSSGTSGTTSSSSSSSSSSSGDPTPTGDDAGASSGTPAPQAVPAPTMDRLVKMGGALHVMWLNPTNATCDAIELERKADGEAFAVAYTLGGSIDNKHDGQATKDTTYTYRTRCKVGAAYSPYSNEIARNPMK